MKNLKNLLYILQILDYDSQHFKKWVATHKVWAGLEKKKKLIWTLKARLFFFTALIFHLLTLKTFRLPFYLILTVKIWSFPEWVIKTILVWLAKIKIRRLENLIVIGITGSYGKTSTKEILFHILSGKFKVAKTPESYNTPLGISRVILRDLTPKHNFFIVEMGAYNRGDIKTLCDIVKPRWGIITAIGKQHLERFGTLEKIISAKFELVNSLPENGIAVLNSKDPLIKKGLEKFLSPKKKVKILYLSSHYIKSSLKGCSFFLSSGGEVQHFHSPLLGKHNVENILAAIALACQSGMKLKEIAKAVSTLPQIPHRLKLIKGENDTLIIDDAYNSNPSSFRAALDVLKEAKTERKIIVTPGVVELGGEQYQENFKLGQEIAKVVNYAIIVGETNRKALVSGIKSISSLKSLPQILEAANLSQAVSQLKLITIPRSVILFENDLPDNY